MPTSARIGLLDDANALVPGGYLDTILLLDLAVDVATTEDEPPIWEIIVEAIQHASSAWKLGKKEVVEGFQAFGQQVFGARARKVGWSFQEREDVSLSKHKALMFEAAGQSGLAE